MSDADRSALETLFSGKPKVAATDERAATALASAFSEEFTPDATAPWASLHVRRPTHSHSMRYSRYSLTRRR